MNLYHAQHQLKTETKNQRHELSFQISLIILLLATWDIWKTNILILGETNNAKTELEALK